MQSNLRQFSAWRQSCHHQATFRCALASSAFVMKPATVYRPGSHHIESHCRLERPRPGRPRRPIILRAPSAGGLTPSLPPPLSRAAPPRAASAFPVLSSSALCGRPDTAAAFGAAASSSFGALRTLAATICARLAATAFAAAASSSLGVPRVIRRLRRRRRWCRLERPRCCQRSHQRARGAYSLQHMFGTRSHQRAACCGTD